VDAILDLAGDKRAMPDVRAAALMHLKALDTQLAGMSSTDTAVQAHVASARHDIATFMNGNDDPSARPRFPVIILPWP